MAMRRTTMYSGAGKKLYAVRAADGTFKDIQTYERAHRADMAHKSAAEKATAVRKSAKKKAPAKKAAKAAAKKAPAKKRAAKKAARRK
jgi:ferric-dicitrate binding protein FerR (iron transport regulator)